MPSTALQGTEMRDRLQIQASRSQIEPDFAKGTTNDDQITETWRPSGESRIRIVPSRISLCDSGVGWIVADGRLVDSVLIRENSVLFCEGLEPAPLGDVEIVRDEATGVLSNRTEDDQRILYYHPVGGN